MTTTPDNVPAIGPQWAADAPFRDDVDLLCWPKGAVALLQWDDESGQFDTPDYAWQVCNLYLPEGWPSQRAWSYPADAPQDALAKAVSIFLSGWQQRPIRFEQASVLEEAAGGPTKRHALLIAFYADDGEESDSPVHAKITRRRRRCLRGRWRSQGQGVFPTWPWDRS